MNELVFAKMEGAGNDFIVLEGVPPEGANRAQWITQLCDRRRGIGADGVLWMEPTTDGPHAFRMHFFNNDGGRVNLCLNGGRCVAQRAVDLGWASGSFSFQTEKGELQAEVNESGVALALAAPTQL